MSSKVPDLLCKQSVLLYKHLAISLQQCAAPCGWILVTRGHKYVYQFSISVNSSMYLFTVKQPATTN